MKGVLKATRSPGIAWREDLPTPSPQEGEVLVKVKAAAICGTDIHIYDWTPWAQARVKPPMVFGHEFSGEVVETGPGTSRVKKGDHIAGETHIDCGKCFECMTGNAHICEQMKIVGVQSPGVFSEYAVIPESCAWVLGDAMSYEHGACLEPMGVAMHGLEACCVSGKNVVILGCGPIGLMAVSLASILGAEQIIVSEPADARLEKAKSVGATLALNPREQDLKQAVLDATRGRGAEVVLDYSGNPHAITAGFELIAKGGTMVLVGLPSEPITIDVNDAIIYREAHITGVTGRTMYGTWYKCQRIIESGKFDLSSFIAARYSLAEFEQAIQAAKSGIPGKVLLVP